MGSGETVLRVVLFGMVNGHSIGAGSAGARPRLAPSSDTLAGVPISGGKLLD